MQQEKRRADNLLVEDTAQCIRKINQQNWRPGGRPTSPAGRPPGCPAAADRPGVLQYN